MFFTTYEQAPLLSAFLKQNLNIYISGCIINRHRWDTILRWQYKSLVSTIPQNSHYHIYSVNKILVPQSPLVYLKIHLHNPKDKNTQGSPQVDTLYRKEIQRDFCIICKAYKTKTEHYYPHHSFLSFEMTPRKSDFDILSHLKDPSRGKINAKLTRKATWDVLM